VLILLLFKKKRKDEIMNKRIAKKKWKKLLHERLLSTLNTFEEGIAKVSIAYLSRKSVIFRRDSSVVFATEDYLDNAIEHSSVLEEWVNPSRPFLTYTTLLGRHIEY